MSVELIQVDSVTVVSRVVEDKPAEKKPVEPVKPEKKPKRSKE